MPAAAAPAGPSRGGQSTFLTDEVARVGLTSDADFWQTFGDQGTEGRGHFAKVKRVRHHGTGDLFAAKILDKRGPGNCLSDLVREFNMLCAIRHPNIVRLHAAYESPTRLYLVTELASGGELMRRLGSDTNRPVYSEDEVRKHVRAIVGAVKYMHAHGAVHRDLKPENVLLSDAEVTAEIRIVDLGLARFFSPEERVMCTICGTRKYLAPELVRCDRGEARGYDSAVDMWGVGLLCYVMLFGFNPFERGSTREMYDAIEQADFDFPARFTASAPARAFVSRLLRRSAEERYSAAEAEADPWLRGDVLSPGPLLRLSSPGLPQREVRALLSEWNDQRAEQQQAELGHAPPRTAGKGAPSGAADAAVGWGPLSSGGAGGGTFHLYLGCAGPQISRDLPRPPQISRDLGCASHISGACGGRGAA